MLQFQENCGKNLPPTREQYRTMRFSCGKQGDGESTLRTWMARKYIVFDDENRNFCKTEDYMKRVRLAS